MPATVQRFRSADGTEIGCERTGEGPPLLLVHGAAGDHTRWAPVVPALAEHQTVLGMDRRGRGLSGDAGEYAGEREIEDVVAVVEGIGEPVVVVAHSFGAMIAVEAARRTGAMRRLVLYEPPASSASSLAPPGVLDEVDALVARGDRDAAVALFMQEVAGVRREQVEAMRALPAWEGRKAVAHTLAREMRFAQGYDFDGAAFAEMRVPTLVLRGSESPAALSDGATLVYACLPDARLETLAGQGHTAMDTAPDLFVDLVGGFARG